MSVGKGANKLPPVGITVGYENQSSRLSVGAENIALYPKLKEQLKQQHLQNLVEEEPLLKHASIGTGNFTERSIIISEAESNRLGLKWVGDKAKLSKNKSALVSEDGSRKYRFPEYKKYSPHAETGVQSNFERINPVTGETESNLHLNIGDK